MNLSIFNDLFMPLQKLTQTKILSLAVVCQFEMLILRDILRPSERQSSERELAVRMGVPGLFTELH